MATTFTAIASVTVGAGGASTISFTSIPSTFTDLCILLSARDDRASVSNAALLSFNGSSSNFAGVTAYTDGYTNVGSFNSIPRYAGAYTATNSTSSTFGNGKIYIPNYTTAYNKTYGADGVGENNGSENYLSITGTVWSDSSAITSITLTPSLATLFNQYSSAYLYGIKNS
jgi:hypothetical protein